MNPCARLATLVVVNVLLFSDLLKSDSNNATALYVKAMCYYYQDVPDRATQFFHHALRVDPDHSKSRLALKVRK